MIRKVRVICELTLGQGCLHAYLLLCPLISIRMALGIIDTTLVFCVCHDPLLGFLLLSSSRLQKPSFAVIQMDSIEGFNFQSPNDCSYTVASFYSHVEDMFRSGDKKLMMTLEWVLGLHFILDE